MNLISKILFFWGHNTARLLFHPPVNSDSPRSDRIGDVGQSLPIWARDDLISKKIKCCRRSALDILPPPQTGEADILLYFIARHCYMCCFRSKLLPKSGGHSQETLAVRVWCFVFVKNMYVYRLKFINTWKQKPRGSVRADWTCICGCMCRFAPMVPISQLQEGFRRTWDDLRGCSYITRTEGERGS